MLVKDVTTVQMKFANGCAIFCKSGVTLIPAPLVLPPPSFLFFPSFSAFLLTGLEAFSSSPQVLSSLDMLAVGKILLMETLEPCQPNEMPVAMLYDTSQNDDININSACLKNLQDKTMNNPLNVRMVELTVCLI